MAFFSDKNIQIGDIVTGYHKGYWRVTQIQRRFLDASMLRYEVYKGASVGDEYNSIIHYERVLDDNGLAASKTKKSCDLAYCEKVDQKFLDKMNEDHKRKIDAIRAATGL